MDRLCSFEFFLQAEFHCVAWQVCGAMLSSVQHHHFSAKIIPSLLLKDECHAHLSCAGQAPAPAQEQVTGGTTLSALQQLVSSVSHNAIATALPFTAQTQPSSTSGPIGAQSLGALSVIGCLPVLWLIKARCWGLSHCWCLAG